VLCDRRGAQAAVAENNREAAKLLELVASPRNRTLRNAFHV